MPKYTSEQKRQLKELRKILAREKNYKPMGQGDSVNQHLKIRDICRDIEDVKSNPEYKSNRIICI